MKSITFDNKVLEGLKTQLSQILSQDSAIAGKASMDFAEAVAVPLREVLLSGDIINGIYTPVDFTNQPQVIYPLDLLTPGDEAEFKAYVVPDQGDLPHAAVYGDYVSIPTYRVANTIDTSLRFIKDANWAVIRRMLQILEAGMIKKMNDDGWQCIISAANDRNVIVYDVNAVQGQFTPRLISLMQTYMMRNGGGNSATTNKSKLTDLYLSPEAHMDIRAWGLDLIPDGVRQAIYYANQNSSDLINIFGVNLHAIHEFGVNQEYQLYWTNTLSGSLSTQNDLEIVVGLDLGKEAFIMPVKEDVKVFEDNTFHRRGQFSLYSDAWIGMACLDSRAALLGSL